MSNEFTAVIERDGEWYIGYCPEIPGANGQGRSKDECLKSLAAAIGLILGGSGVRSCISAFSSMGTHRERRGSGLGVPFACQA